MRQRQETERMDTEKLILAREKPRRRVDGDKGEKAWIATYFFPKNHHF